jgi:hypothetical protein
VSQRSELWRGRQAGRRAHRSVQPPEAGVCSAGTPGSASPAACAYQCRQHGRPAPSTPHPALATWRPTHLLLVLSWPVTPAGDARQVQRRAHLQAAARCGGLGSCSAAASMLRTWQLPRSRRRGAHPGQRRRQDPTTLGPTPAPPPCGPLGAARPSWASRSPCRCGSKAGPQGPCSDAAVQGLGVGGKGGERCEGGALLARSGRRRAAGRGAGASARRLRLRRRTCRPPGAARRTPSCLRPT